MHLHLCSEFRSFSLFTELPCGDFSSPFVTNPECIKLPLEHSTMCDSRTYLNCIFRVCTLAEWTMHARAKYDNYEFSFFPRTVAAWKEFEFPSDTNSAQIWQCSNRTLPLLIISCPGHTNHCLTPCFYLSLLLTVLSLSSPFLINNLCFLSPLPHMPISILLDGKLCTWNLKHIHTLIMNLFWNSSPYILGYKSCITHFGMTNDIDI